MTLYQIAEIFGHSTDNGTRKARKDQAKRACPFRKRRCAKGGKSDPLGVCSLSDGTSLATLCPNRFLEGSRIFVDVGRTVFGSGARVIAVPEVRILRIAKQGSDGQIRSHRIGKVDFLIAKLDSRGVPSDFAALEIQAVYFSGPSVRQPFNHFMRRRVVPEGSARRPDWRSSAQKRLMPQLALKIPVFRRWGKKFFVAVDSQFFGSLPRIKTVSSVANSEVTWLVYPFAKVGHRYEMGDPAENFSTWDDVLTALREGVAPDPDEILQELLQKKRQLNLPIHTT